MPDKYKDLFAPPLVALFMMVVRGLLVPSEIKPVEFIGHILATLAAGYLVGFYMIAEQYPEHVVIPAVALCGVFAPNVLIGFIKLSRQFRDNPKGVLDWIAETASRFRR